MITKLLILLIALTFVPLCQAAPQKYEQETEIATAGDSKFTISAGWSFDPDTQTLTSPEGDLFIHLRVERQRDDFEQMSLDLWQSIHPDFDYSVFLKESPPATEGWDEMHNVIYEVPAAQKRSIITGVRIFGDMAYVLLVEGTNDGLGKRGAQLGIVAQTWRPVAMRKEDLNSRTAKAFDAHIACELDHFIKSTMKKMQVPGVAIAIVQNGELVYRKGFGVKQLKKKTKVTPQTLFMIGSTTKPLTTLMLAKLVELGKMSWDMPIVQALPSWKLANQETTSKFQMKHTACASTGMPRRDMETLFCESGTPAEDIMITMGSMVPTTGFGETFQYSNLLVAAGGFAGGTIYNKGTDLLSKYENAMQDLIFDPLDMTSTRVRPHEEDDFAQYAFPHSRDFFRKVTSMEAEDWVYPVAPAGSVWSNVDDMAKYVMMELAQGKNENGEQVFAPEQLLSRRVPGVKVCESVAYGLGLMIEKDKGIEVIHHGGNTMGFSSDMFFLPDHGIGVVVLTNSANNFRSPFKQKLFELLFGAEQKADEQVNAAVKIEKEMQDKMRSQISIKAKDTAWIGDYVGEYENADLGVVQIVKCKKKYQFISNRWVSDLGSKTEELTGEKLIAFVSQPLIGMQLRVECDPRRKLILNDVQVTYEFVDMAEEID